MIPSSSLGGSSIRLFAVVVLYKQAPFESATVRSLIRAIEERTDLRSRLHVLLYDNSPESGEEVRLPEGFDYERAAGNAGLAAAYNRALQLAIAEGCEWLLTLDQDTALPSDFLVKLFGKLDLLKDHDTIAAVVPQIEADGRILSPHYFRWGFVPRFLERGFTGVPDQAIYAFNSASSLRVSALREIGGYTPLFWLDMSDAFMFRQLHLLGKKIYLAGDIRVTHEFAMADIRGRMNEARYQNIVDAGGAFWDLELGRLARCYLVASYTYRLLIKHRKHHDPRGIRRITRRALLERLAHSRSRRIEIWKARTRKLLEARMGTEPVIRPRLSVCIATYNGEKYVVQQLESILSQLSEDDEVIVVDDASRDSTVEKILSLNDARIRIYARKTNRGVLKTFEEAVTLATGTIIFLSDQDDRWRPDKVAAVLEAFRMNPDVKLVASDAELIDERDSVIRATYYADFSFRTGFWANLYRNRYHGCTMAFRSRLIPVICPFPSDADVLHDVWIGMRARLTGSKTHFIGKPLVQYRRHDANVTGRRLPLRRQFKVRFDLLVALVADALRRDTGGRTLPLTR